MTPGGKRVILVAAVAANGVIGDQRGLPWHLPEDFAHFKHTTMGHILLMGRATFESIGRVLPGRSTVVLTRDRSWSADGVVTAADLAEAWSVADTLPGEVMVAGGAQVYAATLPYADEQVITEVPLSPEGDTRFPDVDPAHWVETRREHGDHCTWVWRTRQQ